MGDKAQPLVKADRMGLGAQRCAPHPADPREMRQRRAHQPRAHAAAARLAQDRDAADLGHIALQQDPRRADRPAGRVAGQQVDRPLVQPVPLLLLGHRLLDDEDRVADRPAGGDVVRDPDHAKNRSRMRS